VRGVKIANNFFSLSVELGNTKVTPIENSVTPTNNILYQQRRPNLREIRQGRQ